PTPGVADELPVRRREGPRLEGPPSGGGRAARGGAIPPKGYGPPSDLHHGPVDGGPGLRPRVVGPGRGRRDRTRLPAPSAVPTRGPESAGMAADREARPGRPRGPRPVLRPRPSPRRGEAPDPTVCTRRYPRCGPF